MIKFTMGASDNKKTQRRKPKRTTKSGSVTTTGMGLNSGFGGFLTTPLIPDIGVGSAVGCPTLVGSSSCPLAVVPNGLFSHIVPNGVSKCSEVG